MNPSICTELRHSATVQSRSLYRVSPETESRKWDQGSSTLSQKHTTTLQEEQHEIAFLGKCVIGGQFRLTLEFATGSIDLFRATFPMSERKRSIFRTLCFTRIVFLI